MLIVQRLNIIMIWMPIQKQIHTPDHKSRKHVKKLQNRFIIHLIIDFFDEFYVKKS